MGLVLGRDIFYSIPPWFHEGVANYETLKGNQYIPNRSLNRLDLWLMKKELPQAREFISYNPNESDANVGIFYSVSYEVVRFLVKYHGESALTSVIDLMKQGISFEQALLTQLPQL